MGCRSPSAAGWDRMQPRAKSEASASMVKGSSGWKCWRMGAKVKADWSAQKDASALLDQVNLTPFRVRVVRGVVSSE